MHFRAARDAGHGAEEVATAEDPVLARAIQEAVMALEGDGVQAKPAGNDLHNAVVRKFVQSAVRQNHVHTRTLQKLAQTLGVSTEVQHD